MKTKAKQIIGIGVVVVACLAAQIGLVLLGSSFRVAARMSSAGKDVAIAETRLEENGTPIHLAGMTGFRSQR